ncbi:MAG: hypothetical protein U0167_17285 [bacterium]
MSGRVRRVESWPVAAATVLIVAITAGCTLGLIASGSRAASLCAGAYGHACGNGYPNVYNGSYYGFATTGQPCAFQGSGYAVFVSSSSNDPHVNTGPITDDSLYLWTIAPGADWAYGWAGAFAEFWGDMHVVGFEPAPGCGGSLWRPDFLTFAVGCNPGLYLVGRLIVTQPVAVEPETWGRMKALYR